MELFAFTALPTEGLEEWWADNGWPVEDTCAEEVFGLLPASLPEYGVVGTPAHVFVDSAGLVRYSSLGAMADIPEWLDGR